MNYNGCVHVGLTKLRQIMQRLIPRLFLVFVAYELQKIVLQNLGKS